LGPLQATSTQVELVSDGREGVGDPVKLGSELSALLLKTMVAIYFCNCCQVVEASGGLDKGVEATVSFCKEGEEPRSCGVHGGLSIVRTEEEFDDICGFPRLPPCQ
jgi:hypothetical protein